ncbi:MAG: serine/threonine-protein phosphatase [Planctomycetes bacterium]|nr:serine/threonine-protein phosphatase [Planctomycetota bacterium]
MSGGSLFGRGTGRAEIRTQVARSVQTLPTWKIRVAGRWVCPFCTTLIKVSDMAQLVDLATNHLHEVCGSFQGGQGIERPLAELESFAAYQGLRREVRQRLLKSPSWQLLDVGRQWVCPYCATPTGVAIPPTSRMDSETLSGIVDHVEGCLDYDRGQGSERDLSSLKAALRGNNKRRQLAGEVRSRLEGDPIWRRKDPRGRWECPYCRGVQEDIDLSSTFKMFEDAPDRIARHLLDCQPYRDGESPAPLETTSRQGMGAYASGSGAMLFVADDDETLPPHLTQSQARAHWQAARSERTPIARPFEDDDDEDDALLPLAAPTLPPPTRTRKTLRELESSGEFLLIDTELPRASPTSGSERAPGGGLTPEGIEVDAWREEIERSLATVRGSGSAFGISEQSPEASLDLPDLISHGLDLGGLRLAARPPRGDFAEVVQLGQGRLALFVGGVTGDDADVPMIASLVVQLMREESGSNRDPADVLRQVNQTIHPDLDGRSFVAVTFALLDLASGSIRLARAGTSPPLLLRPGQPSIPLDIEGMVMGIDPGPLFANSLEVRTLVIEPDEFLLLYSNGLIEGRGEARKELGLDRLTRLLERYGRHEVDYFTDKFKEQYERFLGGSPQTQDACLLGLRRAANNL